MLDASLGGSESKARVDIIFMLGGRQLQCLGEVESIVEDWDRSEARGAKPFNVRHI